MATLIIDQYNITYSGYATRLTQFLTNRRKIVGKPSRTWR